MDLSFRNPVRRIRMPSPLPLVDTHPLDEDCLFPAWCDHHPRRLHRSSCRFSFADHHVARGHVGRFARRAGAESTGGRQASTPDGENTPSRLRVNDLRAESRLGVA